MKRIFKKIIIKTIFSFFVFTFSIPAFAKDEKKSYADPELDIIYNQKAGIERTKTRLPDIKEGWGLQSLGGLSYSHRDDHCYWFKISGELRVDDTFFSGSFRDKQTDFPSGANIRTFDLFFDGGVGRDWTMTLGLFFGQNTTSTAISNGMTVLFSDTWISYIGLLAKNNEIFIGRVPAYWFGLDNSNSASWNPFLERSMLANAFYPGDGLGIMTDFWWDDGAITFVASTVDHANKLFANDNTAIIDNETLLIGDDRWRGIVRLTYAPFHEKCDLWHFGLSGAYIQTDSRLHGVLFGEVRPRTYPDGRARNTSRLVDTGLILGVTHVALYDIEAARLCGPLLVEGDFAEAYAYRTNGLHGTLHFYGWNLQARYLLTGGSHEYDVRDGSFNKPLYFNKYWGAIEVAARYDYLNLNDKDIIGGTEHNVTLGFNWFINKGVRASIDYVRANIHPGRTSTFRNQRTLDIIGARLQVRFK